MSASIFAPEHTGEVVPTRLTNPLGPIFAIFNSAQALHLTHAILLERPASYEPGGKYGAMLAVTPEPRPSAATLAKFEQEEAIAYLSIIVQQLDIKVGPLNSGVGGSTSWRPERMFPNDLPGRGSTITVGAKNLEKINEAFATNNVMAQQYWIFSLARLLFHEIGHAITFALHTSMRGHCYLGNAVTCEIGFELESRLFGGVLAEVDGSVHGPTSNNHLNFGLEMHAWPYPATLDGYRFTSGVTNFPTRGAPVDRWIRHWKVPFAYINRMFQDEFWQNLTLTGPNALVFYPMVGYLVGILPVADEESFRKSGTEMYLLGPTNPSVVKYVPSGFEPKHNGPLIMRVEHSSRSVGLEEKTEKSSNS